MMNLVREYVYMIERSHIILSVLHQPKGTSVEQRFHCVSKELWNE